MSKERPVINPGAILEADHTPLIAKSISTGVRKLRRFVPRSAVDDRP
jgi:hypothetical protein